MGTIALLTLLSALIFSIVPNSSGDMDDGANGPEPDDTGDTPDQPETPGGPEEAADSGASFEITETGVALELGADETGSLAVIYYEDTEDTGNPDTFVQVDEARFYLVPEGTDWSNASWETRDDVPGLGAFDGRESDYELDDFEASLGLELLGVVDLMGIPTEEDERPADRIGEITANAPVPGYYLTAQTDGDELFQFLPEDYVITRDGVPETSVTSDTVGTDGTDWFSADADGITVDGAGGNDYLDTGNDNVTLIGGPGDDRIEASGAGAIISAGDGDDIVSARDADVDGGAGDDRLTITSGSATGGDGDDQLASYGLDQSDLFGDAGNDRISVSGTGSQGFGGAGDDFIGASNAATAYGGDGDDRIQLESGTAGFGGAGDDTFTVWNQFRDADGPAVVTGGDGADTIDARVWNASGGEAEQIYMRVTDFDVAEDVLQVGVFQTQNEVDDVEDVEADDGSYTDVRVTYTAAYAGQAPGVAIIRLEGARGVSADQIVIT